jgi:hypothetical protein
METFAFAATSRMVAMLFPSLKAEAVDFLKFYGRLPRSLPQFDGRSVKRLTFLLTCATNRAHDAYQAFW